MKILSSLLFSQKSSYRLVKLILGCTFLLVGVLLINYLIFLILSPHLGQIESGIIASLILSVIGLSLLFNKSESVEKPVINQVDTLMTNFKSDIIEALKKHPFSGLLISLVAGLALSQIKEINGIESLFEKLKEK